jgi:hypothetical protein
VGGLFTALALLLVEPGIAEGGETEEPAEASDTWTVVAVAPAESAIAVALRAQLVDLPVHLHVEDRNLADQGALPAQLEAVAELVATHDAELVVWFELDERDHLYLFLSEGGKGRTLVRELPRTGQSETGRAASAAVIVRGVIEALVGGGQLGVERFETVETLPPAPPEAVPEKAPETKRARPRVVLDLAAAYGIEGFSTRVPVAHAVVIGPDLWIGRNALVALRFRGTIPTTVTGSGVELELHRYPIELGLRGAAAIRDVDVGGGVVGVLELQQRKARPIEDGVTIHPAELFVGGALGPVFQVGWQAHPRVRLFAELAVDFHLVTVEYVVAGVDEPLLRPFTVRPRGQLGVAFAVNPPKGSRRQ